MRSPAAQQAGGGANAPSPSSPQQQQQLRLGILAPANVLMAIVPYLKQRGVDTAAIWCPNAEAAMGVAGAHDIAFAADRPDEVLLRRDVDMVLAACRPAMQAHVVIKALGIGKHVLATVPLAAGLSAAGVALQSAQYYPQVTAACALSLRQLAGVRRLRRLVAGATLGRVTMIEINVQSPLLYRRDRHDWLWDAQAGGGVLNLLAVHFVDLCCHLLGDDERAAANGGERLHVAASGQLRTCADVKLGGTRRLTADDYALLTIDFGSPVPTATAVIAINAVMEQPYSHVMRITCSGGSYCYQNGRVHTVPTGGGSGQRPKAENLDGDALSANDATAALLDFPFNQLPPFTASFGTLLEHLSLPQPPPSSPNGGRPAPSAGGDMSALLHAMRICDAARRSATERRGAMVPVEGDDALGSDV